MVELGVQRFVLAHVAAVQQGRVGDDRELRFGPQVAEQVAAQHALLAVHGERARQVGARPQVTVVVLQHLVAGQPGRRGQTASPFHPPRPVIAHSQQAHGAFGHQRGEGLHGLG
jgi:hypothetical protein